MCVAGVVIIKSGTNIVPPFLSPGARVRLLSVRRLCAWLTNLDGWHLFPSFCKTTLSVVCLISHPLFTNPDAFSPSCSPCRVTAKVIP